MADGHRQAEAMPSGSFGWGLLLVVVNAVTLLLMTPLNSLIAESPDQDVCLSCLVSIYGGGILALGLVLVAANWCGWFWVCAKWLLVAGVVSFVNLVQVTMVDPSWSTPYVVLCVVVLTPVLIGFVRSEPKTVMLVHQFLVILFLYEMFHTGQIALQVKALDAVVASAHKPEPKRTLDEKGHHVFWIVFDEFSLVQSLRDGHFDENLMPNLAKFSRTSTWYPQAQTLYPLTSQAITALLLGKKWKEGAEGSPPDFVQMFLLNFDARNYLSSLSRTMEVFIVGAYLPYCRAFQQVAEGCLDFKQAFDNPLPLIRMAWDRTILGLLVDSESVSGLGSLIVQTVNPEFPITRAFDAGQSFDHPTLTYIHERLPHFPYQFTGDGAVVLLTNPNGPSPGLDPGELESLRQSYREQLRYLDSLFGEFLARLQRRNLYDQSWIVIMSDHGTSFDPRNPGRRAIGHEQVDRVPFLIRSPGQTQGEVNPLPVHTAEFFEILLERMAQGTQHASSLYAERL